MCKNNIIVLFIWFLQRESFSGIFFSQESFFGALKQRSGKAKGGGKGNKEETERKKRKNSRWVEVSLLEGGGSRRFF